LRVRGSDDAIYITVFDSGPGMAPDTLEHIFEPYWRGSDETPGMGLGLSVSRKLAQLLGGEITAESKPGAGSTFTLRLRTE
jgi:signal transduction histidine kinase